MVPPPDLWEVFIYLPDLWELISVLKKVLLYSRYTQVSEGGKFSTSAGDSRSWIGLQMFL